MKKIIVDGGHSLDGVIEVSGMKNSALPIIFACLLIKEECILENMPRVSDVENSLEILRRMGAEAEFVDAHSVKINTKNAKNLYFDMDLVSKMRASSYLMSSCLARYGSVHMIYPGGCNFGARPIEQHIKGFRALGASCTEDGEFIALSTSKRVQNAEITLDKISVGATINMIVASCIGKGTVIIRNVAKEPHVLDLISFLNICGADITLYGDYIKVVGVSALKGKRYRIYSDMIEALTYATCVGAAKGEIRLKNVNYEHVLPIIPCLEKTGIAFKYKNGFLQVKSPKRLVSTSVFTAPYPDFPTDLHPQLSAMLCFCEGVSEITETIFPKRFAYLCELEKMGAKFEKIGNKVTIYQSSLHGAVLDATDLRAGAALIVASLGASGRSEINNVNYIVRGYEDIVPKLSSVGAKIFYDNK